MGMADSRDRVSLPRSHFRASVLGFHEAEAKSGAFQDQKKQGLVQLPGKPHPVWFGPIVSAKAYFYLLSSQTLFKTKRECGLGPFFASRYFYRSKKGDSEEVNPEFSYGVETQALPFPGFLKIEERLP